VRALAPTFHSRFPLLAPSSVLLLLFLAYLILAPLKDRGPTRGDA
jgi:hypothetical protein